MPQYGYRANRMIFDSTLSIPTTCGVPTLKSNITKKAAIAFDSCNNKFYRYNPKTAIWSEVAGGGTTIDTTSLSNRINSKADTSINLQQVTDNGDSTTNNIYLTHDATGWNNSITLFSKTDSGVKPKIEIASLNGFTVITPDYSYINDASNNQLQLSSGGLNFNNPTNYSVINPIQNGYHFYRLYQADTSKHNDTIALLKDIRNSITTIDTANKWVNGLTLKNDSSFYVTKGTSTDSITIRGVSYAAKLKTQVYNNTGVTIAKGSVVYISGRHSSNLATIALAEGNNELNSYKTFALVENDIANSASGYVIQAGKIENLNLPTATYTDGDILYLSPTVAGGYTTTKPLARDHICKLGSVTRAHPTLGSIEIKIENGWQLDELSDVKIAVVPNDSTLLQFSRVDSLWHDVSVTNAIGTKYLKPTDTTSLSSRINLKVNISDTNTMLLPYLRKIDTASLSSRINTKLTASDTSSLSSRINLKVNISDTGTMLTKYLRKSDTATLSSRIDAKGYALNLGGTNATINASSTYYLGIPGLTITSSAAIRRVYIPKSGTIVGAQLYVKTTNATTTENWTISIRLNNSSNTTLATVGNTATDKVFGTTSLSIAVVAGDYIEITTTTPAFVTAPGSTYIYGSIFIQ